MLGFWPYAKQVSIGVPTGKPAMSRPPEMQSIIANSSATRVGGLYSASELPSTQIAVSVVRRGSEGATRVGEGSNPEPFLWGSVAQTARRRHHAGYFDSAIKFVDMG